MQKHNFAKFTAKKFILNELQNINMIGRGLLCALLLYCGAQVSMAYANQTKIYYGNANAQHTVLNNAKVGMQNYAQHDSDVLNNITNHASSTGAFKSIRAQGIDNTPQISNINHTKPHHAQINSVLNHKPNPLANIAGLHSSAAYVPLGGVSPIAIQNFVSALDVIRMQYIHAVDDDRLFDYAIDGMLAHLDGHAQLLDKQTLQYLQEFTEGHLAHIGLQLEFDDAQNAWVVAQIEPSVSQKYDINVGDYVHQIGDVKLHDGLSQKDIAQMLSGIISSEVTIISSHKGRGKKTQKLVRTFTKDSALSLVMHDTVAYIRLPIFTNTTPQELMQALSSVSSPIHAIIIDVRGNPGGVLSAALEVASLFTPNKDVLRIRSRTHNVQILRTNGAAILDDLPIFVLQNRYSASSAEVLALVLSKDAQSHVAGEISYGKGSIQSIIPLDDMHAIKLSTAVYESIDGTSIDGEGVVPDIVLDFDDADWFAKFLQLVKKKQLLQGIVLTMQDIEANNGAIYDIADNIKPAP